MVQFSRFAWAKPERKVYPMATWMTHLRIADNLLVTFRFNPQRGASDIYVNGDLVEGKIRTIEVSNCVSPVSAIAEALFALIGSQPYVGSIQMQIAAMEEF